MKMQVVAGIAVAALVGAMSLVGPATAASASSGFMYHNVADGKCLDAALSANVLPGDKIQVWDCWGGGNQHWDFANCNINGCEVVNQLDQMCLDAESHNLTSNGDKVQLWPCTGGLNQYWTSGEPRPDFSGWSLVNAADGKCLDADANNIYTNGATVQLWDCWYVGGFSYNGIGYQIPAPNQAWG
jgi:hypothetical protein